MRRQHILNTDLIRANLTAIQDGTLMALYPGHFDPAYEDDNEQCRCTIGVALCEPVLHTIRGHNKIDEYIGDILDFVSFEDQYFAEFLQAFHDQVASHDSFTYKRFTLNELYNAFREFQTSISDPVEEWLNENGKHNPSLYLFKDLINYLDREVRQNEETRG